MEVSAVFYYDGRMDYKKQGHCVYYTCYHLVISTKYRKEILKAGLGEYLQENVFQITRFNPEIEIREVNSHLDHLHMVLTIPPKMSISSVVSMIKANTSRKMRKRFPILNKVYWGTDGIWSRGYFVSTVGINETTIRKYVQKQGEEDSGQALLEF
ncbi:MAG: IS200/IS605 family transposase [Anaerohalosphaeraceae bacterium]|nr:IS200/IS605 family transposase [Anaerohalosphaeraceae bacterium]